MITGADILAAEAADDWRQGRPLRGPGAANELDHGTLDRQLPTRTAGPDLDLEPAAPDDCHVSRVAASKTKPRSTAVLAVLHTARTAALLM